MHRLFKNLGRLEGFVRLDFHYVELEFFSESEGGLFYKVDDAAVKIFQYSVHYRQRLKLLIYNGILVFWAKDF